MAADPAPEPPPTGAAETDKETSQPDSTTPPVDPACPAGPIATTSLSGCEATSCRSAGDRDRLLRVAGLAPGTAFDPAALDRARDRLERTGLFREVTVRCAPTPSGPALEVAVEPHTFIRRVDIEGQQLFKRRDLQKRIFLRPGAALDLDPSAPGDNEQVRRQIASLERLYAAEGLDGVSIGVSARLEGVDGLALTFTVREGQRARVETIAISHRHLGAPDPTAAAGGDDALACPRISPRRLERLADVSYGDVHTGNLHRQVRDRLRKAFQAVGYVRPRFEPEDGDPRALRETLVTERCWVIRLWQRDSPFGDTAADPSFRLRDPIDPEPLRPPETAPFRRLPLESWSDLLPFGESGVFDREEAARGVDALTRALVARGYPFAEVRLEHRELALRPERRGLESEVRGVIDYTITTHHERRIQGIRLLGAHAFPAAELLGLFETQVYDFFGASGRFDPERFFLDLALLERHYQERGFHAFRFDLGGDPSDEAPRRTLDEAGPEWIVWRYTFRDRGFFLKKRRGELSLYLEVPFSEGPRSRIGDFVVTGATIATTEAIAAMAELGPGRPFGKHFLDAGLARLEAHYRAQGYHQVRIDPFCEAHASESGDESFCDPRALVRADHLDLGLRITEGPQVDVGDVVWRGNARTDAHALTRDLPAAGEPLDQARLEGAMRKLRALGLFSSVRIDTIGLDEDPPRDRADLVVSVEETGYRFLDFAAGVRSIQRRNVDRIPPWAASSAGNLVANADRWATGLGRAFPLDIPDVLLLLEAEYLDLNLRGLGHRLELPLRLGASFSEVLRLASFTPTYVWPRLADTSLQLESRIRAELDRVTDPLDRLEFGLESDLSVPITQRMLAGLTVKGGVLKLASPTELAELVDLDDGLQPQFRVTLRWRYDGQDNPLHPTRGVALSASTSLIWDRDRQTGDFNQFLKWEAAARLTLDLGGPVLALFARYGGSRTFGEDFLPANERFTLGGSNGLRGFADNAVCRYDAAGELDPTCPAAFGGNVVVNGSLELRVPVVPRLGLWMATFVDAGGLALAHDALHGASFRFSSGFGVRWLLGGQIPVRLDVGFPLGSARCVAYHADDAGCTLEDPSTVHFDFLYPF